MKAGGLQIQGRFGFCLVLAFLVFSTPESSAQDRGELLRELQILYPHQSPKVIEARLATVKDGFGLFRSFVPLYYSWLAREGEAIPIVRTLGHPRAWVMGDAHVENFGPLHNGRHFIFTMNDPDDAGRGSVVADLLRFVVSVSLVDSEASVSEILEAYHRGFRDQSHSWSSETDRRVAEATSGGLVPEHRLYRAGELEPLDGQLLRTKDAEELARASLKSLELTLRDKFGEWDFEFVDAYRRGRLKGGSGGLNRYVILVMNTRQEPVILELKEVAPSGMWPLSQALGEKIYEAQTSLKRTFLLKLGKDHPDFYGSLIYDGRSFLIRPRWQGNRGVRLSELKKLSDKKRRGLWADEAYVLGRLHRAGMRRGDRKHFEQSFGRAGDSHWSQSVGRCTDFLGKLYPFG